MKYFKNTELAKIYHVSEKSVRNWIEGARTARSDLQLYEAKGKLYIANTAKNTALVERMVQKGKKYKNSRGYKTVSPSPLFYKQYNSKQIFDIISSIDSYREIPYKYSFFGEGAHNWDRYTSRLLEEGTVNSLTNTIDLLDLSKEYLDRTFGDRRVNVIDIGIGNSVPVRQLLAHLVEKQRLHRYICIDISREMLNIAQRNITQWFHRQVEPD